MDFLNFVNYTLNIKFKYSKNLFIYDNYLITLKNFIEDMDYCVYSKMIKLNSGAIFVCRFNKSNLIFDKFIAIFNDKIVNPLFVIEYNIMKEYRKYEDDNLIIYYKNYNLTKSLIFSITSIIFDLKEFFLKTSMDKIILVFVDKELSKVIYSITKASNFFDSKTKIIVFCNGIPDKNTIKHEMVHFFMSYYTDEWPCVFWREGIAESFYDEEFYYKNLVNINNIDRSKLNTPNVVNVKREYRILLGAIIRYLFNEYGKEKVIEAYIKSSNFDYEEILKDFFDTSIDNIIKIISEKYNLYLGDNNEL